MQQARNVDRSPLAWREVGEGEPLVFLHGLGGTRTAWEAQLEELSDRWRCVAWDMPGYGVSEPIEPFTLPALADAVVALFDALDVERAHLCGLSFGGHQALHAALAHPDRIRSLILADTSPAFGLDGTDPAEWLAARFEPLDRGLSPADFADELITSISGPGFGGARKREVVESVGRISAAGLRAACECLVTHDVRDRLGEITAPTLVVVGELDDETPPAYSEMLAAAIGGAELALIPGVGHYSPAEAPEEFNAEIRGFLTQVDGRVTLP
jgi:3-oxoadipate enol-lactonase